MVGYGISAASGLPELWIAGRNHGGLDYSRYGIDQQLLQAPGSERDSVYGAHAADQRIGDRVAELSASGASRNGHLADRKH